ncbi:MAG: terminase, partial [Oscillospiraceae bacterium]
FRTRSSKGGLGEGFDLLVIDKAQEYADDQESALKYVVTDSRNPQTLLCGTPPTPVSSGTVFLKLRNSALQGETQNTGWTEWSVNQQTDPRDIESWYDTHPSLATRAKTRLKSRSTTSGHGFIRARTARCGAS